VTGWKGQIQVLGQEAQCSNLQILAPAQRRLWDELRQTPREFVLYRGTALALRLGILPLIDCVRGLNRQRPSSLRIIG
jgi:hypothetical protein